MIIYYGGNSDRPETDYGVSIMMSYYDATTRTGEFTKKVNRGGRCKARFIDFVKLRKKLKGEKALTDFPKRIPRVIG